MTSASTISYTNKFVAYVDILGFSDLIKRSTKDSELLNKLTGIFSAIEDMWEEKYDKSGLVVTSFSDNIVLSADDSLQGLLHVAATVDWLANELLKQGVLIRGALDFGLLYHDEKIVLGPVLGVVYGLEQNLAKYPRIVCSHKFLSQIEKISKISASTQEYCNDFRRAALTRDNDDGVCYLHILAGLERVINMKTKDSNSVKLKDRAIEDIAKIVTFLQTSIDDQIESPSIYYKYKWFSEYWNSRVGGLVHSGKSPGLVRITNGRMLHGVYQDYEYPYIGNSVDNILGSVIDDIDSAEK